MSLRSFHFHVSALALATALLSPGLAHAQPAPAQPAAPAPVNPAPAQPKSPDVVVTGTRADIVSSPDRVSFNIANDLQVQTGTLADALRAVPGVEVDLQGNVSLRGDPGVTILIDGRPSAMLSGESRGDVLMSMPAGSIERVEVITNPSAAMSPEGSGGAINLVTKLGRPNSTAGTIRATAGAKGRGSLNLNGSHNASGLTLTGDVGVRRFTGEADAVQLRSRFDPVTDAEIDSRQDTLLENRMTGVTGRFGVEYDADKENRLSAELGFRRIGVNLDREDMFVSDIEASDFDRESDIKLRHPGLNAKASWRRKLPGDDHELVADLEYQKGQFKRTVDAVTDFEAGHLGFERIRNIGDRKDYSAKLDYKRPMGESASLNLGYEGKFGRNAFDSSGARGDSWDMLVPIANLTNRFDYDENVHAFFGTYRFETGKLDVQAGLRLEQVDTIIDQITEDVRVENDYFRAYPTLHLGYDLSEGQQLRASYSRRVQRPSPMDLNPYTFYLDPLNQRRGNPFLKPEVTDSFEVSWQIRKAGTFYSATGFYRRSRGGVTDIITDLGEGAFLTTRENLATADRVGGEFIANGKFSKTLTYNASATVLWHRIDPRFDGISDPQSGMTHTVRGSLNWQPTPKDYLQFNGNLSGKQLLPQGYRRSNGTLNLGYRRKVNDRLSLLLTAQNILDTNRHVVVFETPMLRDRITQNGIGRVLLFGFTYNVGGQSGRQREPSFDFQQPAAGDSVQ